jgi:hypothetical protein
MSKLNSIISGINTLSNSEIDQVITAVKSRRNTLSVQSAQSFVAGNKVSFTGRRGITMSGIVRKVNIKYVVVDIDGSHMSYKVPGSMLKKEVA